MKVFVINGPNLNMLGIREPDIYGKKTYQDLLHYIDGAAQALDVTVEYFQSNHEGDLVDMIQNAYEHADGIVINPAAYTHTSIAILDALKAVGLPAVEVHLSDVDQREDFRRVSFVRDACIGTITGKGYDGYGEGIKLLLNHCAGRE